MTHRPRQGHRASAGLSDVLRVAFQDYFVKFIYSSVQMTLITQKGLFGAIEGSAVFHVNVFIFGQITLYPPRRSEMTQSEVLADKLCKPQAENPRHLFENTHACLKQRVRKFIPPQKFLLHFSYFFKMKFIGVDH